MKVYVVEFRQRTNPLQSNLDGVVMCVCSSIENAEKFISENCDAERRDLDWWWAVQSFELDNDMGSDADELRFYDWNGRYIKSGTQPIYGYSDLTEEDYE